MRHFFSLLQICNATLANVNKQVCIACIAPFTGEFRKLPNTPPRVKKRLL